MWPLGRGKLSPQGQTFTTVVKGHQMMLHAKNLSSNPYSFWQEGFQSFPYIILHKTFDHWGGVNNDPQTFSNFGRGQEDF